MITVLSWIFAIVCGIIAPILAIVAIIGMTIQFWRSLSNNKD